MVRLSIKERRTKKFIEWLKFPVCKRQIWGLNMSSGSEFTSFFQIKTTYLIFKKSVISPACT